MAPNPLAQQIAQLRHQLNTVDTQLARSGTAEGLEELKSAVDTLRTNVWAVLSASRTGNYAEFIVRFRLRRGIDILRAILADFDADGGRTIQAEHSELQILLQQVNERIGRLRASGG